MSFFLKKPWLSRKKDEWTLRGSQPKQLEKGHLLLGLSDFRSDVSDFFRGPDVEVLGLQVAAEGGVGHLQQPRHQTRRPFRRQKQRLALGSGGGGGGGRSRPTVFGVAGITRVYMLAWVWGGGGGTRSNEQQANMRGYKAIEINKGVGVMGNLNPSNCDHSSKLLASILPLILNEKQTIALRNKTQTNIAMNRLRFCC